MSPKRPTPLKPPAAADDWKITDEWGIYDPEKAGIPALFRRLGRPVLRAAPSTSRKERRRAQRPERSEEGVGLALAEAKRRAGYVVEDEMPTRGGNPARAMRMALKAQAAVNVVGTPAEAPYVPPPVEPRAPEQQARTHVPPIESEPVVAPAPKRRARKVATSAPEAPVAAASTTPNADTATAKPRARRTARRPRAEAAEVVAAPQVAEPIAAAAPVAEAPVEIPAPVVPAPALKAGPPAPSPRRPRGPVPLAAWARAVHDAPRPEPVRADTRGFWRSLFRIPAEVALVEYAHGCRIHRLLVEAGDDHVPDFI